MPETKPIPMAETDPKVTGASKKTRPLIAIGSLLRAPTIEYVVLLVTRTHHAEVYEMKMDERPEKSIAAKIALRLAGGKFLARLTDDQSSITIEAMIRIGMVRRLL
jgi:hypothetical protein